MDTKRSDFRQVLLREWCINVQSSWHETRDRFLDGTRKKFGCRTVANNLIFLFFYYDIFENNLQYFRWERNVKDITSYCDKNFEKVFEKKIYCKWKRSCMVRQAKRWMNWLILINWYRIIGSISNRKHKKIRSQRASRSGNYNTEEVSG